MKSGHKKKGGRGSMREGEENKLTFAFISYRVNDLKGII